MSIAKLKPRTHRDPLLPIMISVILPRFWWSILYLIRSLAGARSLC